jgi:hypothetical protein
LAYRIVEKNVFSPSLRNGYMVGELLANGKTMLQPIHFVSHRNTYNIRLTITQPKILLGGTLTPATHYQEDLTGTPDQLYLTADEHTHYRVDLTGTAGKVRL